MSDGGSRWDTRKTGLAVLLLGILAAAVIAVVTWSDDDGEFPNGNTDAANGEVPSGDRAEPYTYVTEATTEPGERATLTNEDDVLHTFTSDDGLFDTGPVDPGAEARLPSLPAGTYEYHCSIHPALTGQLTVSE